MKNKTPFTLRHGRLPEWMTHGDGTPLPADSTGWWVTGVDWGTCFDESTPYLLDTADGPASLGDAEKHFQYDVARMAKRLLGVEHDIVISKWVQAPDGSEQWRPELWHERHTLTIGLTSGRSRTYWGLSDQKVGQVFYRIDEFECNGSDDDGKSTPYATTIEMDEPLDEGPSTPVGGRIVKRTTTTRISAIAEIEHDVRHEPITEEEYAALDKKWADSVADGGR